MSASTAGSVPNLTFVSMSGPLLDKASAKAMRAHTTKANFARRRQRRVREYATRRDRRPGEEDGQSTDRNQAVELQMPISIRPAFACKLDGKDAVMMRYRSSTMDRLT